MQVHYSLTGEGSPQEPRPVSLLGLDSGIYFRHAFTQDELNPPKVFSIVYCMSLQACDGI